MRSVRSKSLTAGRWRIAIDSSIRARREIVRVEVPVISVGNLTLGGTGKSPFVAWIARFLREQGIRVTIVSRGYGVSAGSRNDEALELEQRLPDVPHVQNRDRVAAARVAIDELDCQAIVLDDGFQHRRLARDLDIVLLDACEPFGWDHLVPRGYLREPPANLARRRSSPCRGPTSLTPSDDSRFVPKPNVWPRARCGSKRAMRPSIGSRPAAEKCRSANWPASALPHWRASAIRPAFKHTLATSGLEVVEFREFPDHHPYGARTCRA